MEKVKIAFCIPTYKRPNMIAEFMEQYASRYVERGIDIYIYDSSPDDETREKISAFQKQINSLYYIRLPEKLRACEKLYLIFQQYGMKANYDFIWPCGDTLRYPVEAIDTILLQISLKYDMLHINATYREGFGTRIYEDRNEYFVDCAWHTTLFGAVLLNCNTMLKKVCWKEYEERFLKEKYSEYGHVSFYFHRFLELPNFCVKHISTACSRSKYRKHCGWYERFFEIWCVDWVNTIEGLPDYYIDKDKALLNLGKYAHLQTEYDLLQKRIDGIYDAQIFKQYESVLPRVCDIPIDVLKKIAFMTPAQALEERKKRINEWKATLASLTKKYHGILIYGAGPTARKYTRFFESENILFLGFVVSARNKDIDFFMGYPVYDVEELTSEQKGYGICLGLSYEYHAQVRKTLEEKGMSEQIFFDDELHHCILYEF